MRFIYLFLLLTLPIMAQTLNISVAASMTEAFSEIKQKFETTNPGIKINLNAGASGALTKQIAEGAPVDVFISANMEWMDYLVNKKRVAGKSVQIIAKNSLIFVGSPSSQVTDIKSLIKLTKISIGNPLSVPAGQYAQAAMESAGIYKELMNKNKIVYASTVRQALLYAEKQQVDGAFVFKSDALLLHKAKILFSVPPELYPEIKYPAGITSAGKINESTIFIKFIQSPQGKNILKKYGFTS